VNAAVGFALLAVAQLALSWWTDRALDGTDRAVFLRQVDKEPLYGVQPWFRERATDMAPGVGDQRVIAVLKFAKLGAATRATITALVVTLLGSLAVAWIVFVASPEPELRTLRLGVALAGAAVTAITLFILFNRVNEDRLKALTDDEAPPDAVKGPRARAGRFLKRVRCSDVLTPYATIALMANLCAVAAALGV
jgi:hypothetical protein